MFLRIVTWLRVVAPAPGIWAALLIVPALLIEGGIGSLYLRLEPELWSALAEPYLVCRMMLWGGMAFMYGVYRAFAFHPLYDRAYCDWLKIVPWNVEKPLIGAPPWLVWQDVIVALGLMAASHELTRFCLIIPLSFVAGYLLVNTVLNWLTDEWQLAYLNAFWLCSLPLLYRHWELLLPACVPCLVIGYWATRRALCRFPWDLSKHFSDKFSRIADPVPASSALGWPYSLMAPKSPQAWITLHDGLLLSLLLGWIEFTTSTAIYGAHELWGRPLPPRNILGVLLPMTFICLGRLVIIYGSHWPPISFAGRLWTGRWIIPAYDKMVVMPVLAWLTSAGLHWTLQIEFAAVGTTLAFLMLLVFSPRVEDWWLTGPHRINGTLQLSDCVQLQ